MDALSQVAAGAEHLVQSLKPAYIVGDSSLGLSNFVFWMFICLAITLVVVLVASRRLSLVPKGRFASMVEYGYDFVSGGIAKDVIGHGYEKHVPLLATLFFFILISNFVGLIPGCKTPTGSLSITWALAAVSFVYFIYWGIKAQGLGGYLKSFAPSGLPVPMIPIVWFLELFSTVLRVLTLAVRLYGNMFAGHMVLGIFALLTSLFIGSAIDGAGLLAAAALHRLDRVSAVHVRAGSAGRLPAGVRVHHPVGGVHLAGHLEPLGFGLARPHGRASAGGWMRGAVSAMPAT